MAGEHSEPGMKVSGFMQTPWEKVDLRPRQCRCRSKNLRPLRLHSVLAIPNPLRITSS